MVRILPKFPENLILREQVRLIHKNFVAGLMGYLLLCSIATYVIYDEVADSRVLYWLLLVFVITAVWLIRFYFYKDVTGNDPRKEIIIHTAKVIVLSLVFAYLPLTFMPDATPNIVLTLAIVTGVLAAGSVAMDSPSLPVFLGFTYPCLTALIISLYLHAGPFYIGLAYGAIIFLGFLTWFAFNIESTIHNSIRLRFDNDNLIRKLRSALMQTDEANRAKSVFLASASHDLRQPLHALGLLTETLGSTALSTQQTQIHDHMMSAVESTRSMLDSLLNISKLDAGAISAEPKPFLVNSLLQKLEAELAPTADEHGLIYRTRETIAAVNSDCFIVELILRNLIANAIRYTAQGGLLVACRRRQPNRIVIEVWDTGIGIPEQKINDIFSEFKQLDNPERDAQKGFGLGLAIAQGLASTIDTKITVHSVVDKGSVFRFDLPASNAEVIEDLPKSGKPVDFTGRSVVIIDDDARVRASMESLMISWGCTTVATESAAEAISQIGETKVDILLVDYRLREGRTGKQAIEDLRLHLDCKVPAIIITGDTGTDRLQEAQAADALLLHKPASAHQLQRLMRSLFD